MKKAKIVLSAVALFAVVGGAFAFKASRFNPNAPYIPYQTTINGVATIKCSANPALVTSTLGALRTYYTSTNASGYCVLPSFASTFTTTVE
jgi:uncharacterized protein YxeA